MIPIKFSKVGQDLCTVGLSKFGYTELSVRLKDSQTEEDLKGILEFVASYMLQHGVSVRPNETISYGTATLQLAQDGSHLAVKEFDVTSGAYVAGANKSIALRSQQQQICVSQNAGFEPPRLDQYVVISKGVLDGMPVQGIRYPSPTHMSGWWFTTSQYDGNPETLLREHLVHILNARPELGKYLALPTGYGFSFDGQVYFDERVAAGE